MNNFPSFLDNSQNAIGNNVPRAAPSPSPSVQSHQSNGVANGGMGVGLAAIPQAGQQMDINILWNWVQELSGELNRERAQAADLVAAAQRLASRAAEEGASPTIAQANGEINANRNGTNAADVAALHNQISSSTRMNETLTTEVHALHSLLGHYQDGLSHILDKLRPYASAQADAVTALKAHYLALLQEERDTNLQLRLDAQEWQTRLSRAADLARKALATHTESNLSYVKRIAGLKAENAQLRRMVGWEPAEDSSDDEGGENQPPQMKGLPHHSPNQQHQMQGQGQTMQSPFMQHQGEQQG
ncbi:hypothetical protein K402DRAFT_393509 [Aulographum hederae CBS 113979]|uniref:Uncharacterized protein n=1 Tax=Aulographum hederae CBS 113979 TaxID=1176131 RepID=A0A6G1H0Y8_9PEZI|nr:hypothetical protein K402DRAFT_393509 [Aulographum hederae CBS 113979]